jgi:hypothetical protein
MDQARRRPEDDQKPHHTEMVEAPSHAITRSNVVSQGYTGEDFCEQCKPWISLTWSESSEELITIIVKLLAGSTCPICRFLDATVHAHEVRVVVGSAVLISIKWSKIPFKRPLRIFELQLYRNYDLLQGRFVLPLTTLEGPEVEPEEGHHTWPKIPYRPIRHDTVDINLMREWLNDCRRKHTSSCSEPETDLLSCIRTVAGFKLIDCREKRIVGAPTILEYAALSYVWGQSRESITDNSTSCSSFVDGILPSSLADTIEDAISVTLQLGFRYLWIDKYCIDQSATGHELLMQLSAMDLIYSGAAVTIIAAAGDGTNFGLPGVAKQPRIERPSIKFNGITWISGSMDMQAPLYASKWTTRA